MYYLKANILVTIAQVKFYQFPLHLFESTSLGAQIIRIALPWNVARSRWAKAQSVFSFISISGDRVPENEVSQWNVPFTWAYDE